ncbi:LysR family transcriptional regulator [Moritella yayanosii]|uniref:Putative transcriptional regulatory protein (LysR family) n=1 Tax=Moritella yayanosii TaxID=69539 RepID=A0A330LMH0_9GAMM|nr:LysR family transcriptional regulator [Moritella yayanosii]SQD77873.1 putative transcriptional regulatory protein (LysR family) [Moritella yayanosii]
MDQLRALKYFVKVVEHGSFSKAAELFSVPPSSLSRRIADLEKSLGATLLKRTTRTVNLTEIGQIYYQQVSEVLSLLAYSDDTVRNYQATPMGVLNISSMVGFGERILLPLLDEFRTLYPQITLNVSLSDELSTLGRDEVDLAIRGGYAPDQRVLAIKLMENNFIVVAAPRYLQTHGVPVNAMELKQHKGLYFKTPNGPTPWICEIDNQRQDVSAEQVLISNNGKWLVEKAIAGLGILLMPRWALKPYIESGELTELTITPSIDITQQPNLGVFLLYQKQRYQVPKIKAAVDFLVERVKGVY